MFYSESLHETGWDEDALRELLTRDAHTGGDHGEDRGTSTALENRGPTHCRRPRLLFRQPLNAWRPGNRSLC